MARSSRPSPPQLVDKAFTSEKEIDSAIVKLRRRIEDLKAIQSSKSSYDDPAVTTLKNTYKANLREIFGEHSHQYSDHSHLIDMLTFPDSMGDSDYEIQGKFSRGLPKVIGVLEGLITFLEEKRSEVVPQSPSSPPLPQRDAKKVFVVHGHDEKHKQLVARFLEGMHLKPIILHEQVSAGLTLIEKIETHSDVGFAIVIATHDDIGFSKKTPEKHEPRARQNVIWEWGYFVGLLGRNRVCALHDGAVNLPSDLQGLVWVPLDDNEGWKLKVYKELRAAGYDVSLDGAI